MQISINFSTLFKVFVCNKFFAELGNSAKILLNRISKTSIYRTYKMSIDSSIFFKIIDQKKSSEENSNQNCQL